MNINAQSDTLFIQPWWYLGDEVVGRGNVTLVVVAVSVALGALFLWLTPRYAPLLPALVAVGFFLTWLPLPPWTHSFPRLSSATFSNGIQVQHGDWIDRAVGPDAEVAAIWSGDNEFRIWENEFWNRSIRHVYDLGKGLPGAMPETQLSIQFSTGFLVGAADKPLRARYVLADRTLQIVGTPIAADEGRNLALYRVTPPVRGCSACTSPISITCPRSRRGACGSSSTSLRSLTRVRAWATTFAAPCSASRRRERTRWSRSRRRVVAASGRSSGHSRA